MDKTSIGDRMKGYEAVSKTKLTNRTPVIIRLDGKAFHTWTKKLHTAADDPFDEMMHNMMVVATQHIMANVQNAEIAYTQSDEISILLNDWKTLSTQQWYGNNVQKMVSVTAAAAAAAFNYIAVAEGYIHCMDDLALFDSRAFNIPKDEVNNYFVWRQQDATRNSINMLGQYHFSHKEMHGKNVSQVQDMLMLSLDDDDGEPLNINWNDLDTWKKRGTCVMKNPDSFDSRTRWSIDEDIPIFTADTDYINRHLLADED